MEYDVVILPGVGGGRRIGSAFAGSASTVYDAFASRGLRVAYAGGPPEQIILFESADWWGPVVYIGSAFSLGVAANAIYDGIRALVRNAQRHSGGRVRPHLDITRVVARSPDGGSISTETIHLGGDADIDAFLRALRLALELPEEERDRSSE